MFRIYEVFTYLISGTPRLTRTEPTQRVYNFWVIRNVTRRPTIRNI